MNKNTAIATITVAFIVLVAFGMTLLTVQSPSKIEFSPTEGFTVETDVGPVPIPQSIRDTEESKTYPPIGDTIIENTLVSNSYGFVISIPNDNWKIVFEPEEDRVSNSKSVAMISNTFEGGVIKIDLTKDVPEDWEILMEHYTRGSFSPFSTTNVKEYYVEANDSKVFSFEENFCMSGTCTDFLTLIILKKVDSDLYTIYAVKEIEDENIESNTLNPDMYEILNSL